MNWKNELKKEKDDEPITIKKLQEQLDNLKGILKQGSDPNMIMAVKRNRMFLMPIPNKEELKQAFLSKHKPDLAQYFIDKHNRDPDLWSNPIKGIWGATDLGHDVRYDSTNPQPYETLVQNTIDALNEIVESASENQDIENSFLSRLGESSDVILEPSEKQQ